MKVSENLEDNTLEYIKKAKAPAREENSELTAKIAEVLRRIREYGDEALLEYNRRFGESHRLELRISQKEIEDAYAEVTKQDLSDIKAAAANIRAFAEAQKAAILPLEGFQPAPGIVLGHRIIPVSACCCYVPGGAYPLYSTALMLIIPAKVAGVKRVAACSPCKAGTDRMDARTLVAMDIAGADEIYATGGAQSIGAFAYGTEQIAPVDLIVGPGNQYVTEAKRQCYGQVGIDFVAGPSEVLILADETAEAAIIAADILAQSEHDELAGGILVTTDKQLASEVIDEVEKQLRELPTAEKARTAWRNNGEIILAADPDEAVRLTNEFAPEHLEIIMKDHKDIIPRLINYGSLFIGRNSAEVFGDYASGTNHTLPTMKAARYTGGVYTGTFLKVCTHQEMDFSAVDKLAPLVSRLARGEGLIAHARAAEIRRKK
ncbi:histidinol dehydrogenase [Bacillota bacterium]